MIFAATTVLVDSGASVAELRYCRQANDVGPLRNAMGWLKRLGLTAATESF
jgi:hypothetical protein